MASLEDKFSENVPGKYYVDSECVFCETCIEVAPKNFAPQDNEYAYVKKQPDNDTEEEQCREALESCPADAIGDDGE